MAASALIGTSGFSYKHWQGVFYPEGLPQREWLTFYARHFTTLELNNPFYRLPPRKTFEGWRERAPEGFTYAVKANRFITHIKKLREPEEPLARFFEAAEGLGAKLGPILFQLPPSLKCDPDTLSYFLACLPSRHRYTFEFRHESWFCREIYEILEAAGAALCIASSPRYPMEVVATAPFVYLRLHGSERLYGSEYSRQELKEWARRLRAFMREGRDVYVYFDNDFQAFAVKNAKELLALLSQKTA